MKRFPNSSRRACSGRRCVTLFLLGASIACLLRSGTPSGTAGELAFSRDDASRRISGTVTFSERVGYQYAIEEVYWRHRIWPKDNPGPKPPLDAIVSRRQIENKITDYLRKSQLAADQRGSPITVSELQAELDRMAGHTRQPDVLREIFEALGNDPFLIAECLARPILAGRLSVEREGGSIAPPFDGKSNCEAIKNSWPSAAAIIARGAADPPAAAYTLPEISDACVNDTWTATTTVNAPDGRQDHTAVWTGNEMIIWGGFNSSPSLFLNTGGRYSPATDSWVATSTANAPVARTFHSAVWTGSEVIVWGGQSSNNLVNTGGRYNPVSDNWIPTSTVNAPAAREFHTGVWTGSEVIVWGGLGCGANCRWNTGGRYNPGTDSWTPTSINNAPAARSRHTAVWTGTKMIVWGGTDQTNYLHTGGRYDPANDSWTPTALMNAPLGRVGYGVAWTGNEMFVWGGVDENFNDTDTGGRYNLVNDSWAATSLNNAPSPRSGPSGVWTGSEMIIWGGGDQTQDLNNGGRYNVGTDSWIPTATVNAPPVRRDHTAVWTGTQMIVWGGVTDSGQMNTGGTYCAQPSAPVMQSAVSRKTHAGAASFDVNLPLSGTPGIECRSGGATGDYTIVLTFLANVSVNGSPQAAVTMGTGTIGSGGISNGGMVMTSGNVVTIPLTNVANAQTINVTLNNVNGSTNVTIPMSILIGDANGNGAVNASDVALTKSRSGQPVAAATFRSDVNADGSLNAADVALVKSLAGTGLP